MSYNEGIILIDKPAGLTSHDIVDFIRRRFRLGKVGHAGTLDPLATGLLLILLGRFTKKSVHFSNYDKEYEARLCLGATSDTRDKEGRIREGGDWRAHTEKRRDIEELFASFCGKIWQVPPMYSAKKIKGKTLYKLARKGVVLKRDPVPVFIKEIKISGMPFPYIDFYVRCSKGTYVRQLAHDLGEKIGCGAYLESLRRTKIGIFDVKDAAPFDVLSQEEDENVFYENILQPE